MNKTDQMINQHIANVQLRMEKLSLELEKRSMEHDKSKLEEPEHSSWLFMDRNSSKPKYGTKEYVEKMKKYQSVFQAHYKDPRNRHHPEHWANGVYDMNLIDILEMLCDWVSYKENLSYAEASKIISENCKRFGFDEQLESLLRNTLSEYFVVIGGIGKPDFITEIKNKIIP